MRLSEFIDAKADAATNQLHVYEDRVAMAEEYIATSFIESAAIQLLRIRALGWTAASSLADFIKVSNAGGNQ